MRRCSASSPSAGRALVVAVNKWDHVAPEQRDEIRDQLAARLRFLDFAPVHFISALHGSGVGELMDSVRAAYAAAMREMPTPDLTRILEAAIRQHQPPLVRGRRIRLRYAHQGGRNPPVIVVHGAQAERTPEDYRRYLINCFREAFRLKGTPVRVDFRSEDNPFAGRRDKLTPRQRRTRERQKRRGPAESGLRPEDPRPQPSACEPGLDVRAGRRPGRDPGTTLPSEASVTIA